MKQFIAILFVLMFSYTTYSQNSLQEGDKCFDVGDYTCAEIKYKESYKLANETDKQFVEIKIQRAKWCADNLKTADKAFASQNYSNAKENYQAILDSNPNDSYVKSQIDKINDLTISLNLSKTELNFQSSGGSDKITINLNSYTIELLPAWCTVQKYSGYFEVKCNANNSTSARNFYFNVKAGSKTIRVNVKQLAKDANEVKSYETRQTNQNKSYKPKLSSFSSIGVKSGQIAQYGILYERGGKKGVGFHISARTSFTSDDDILIDNINKNKTVIDLGPNFRITRFLYLNIGVGYGFYKYLNHDDYQGISEITNKG